MEEFERVYLPKLHARKQRARRIKEIGWGAYMAEQAMKQIKLKGVKLHDAD